MNTRKRTLIGIVMIASLIIASSVAAAFHEHFEGYLPGSTLDQINIPGATLSANFGPGAWHVQPDTLDEYVTLNGNTLSQLDCNASLNIDLDTAATSIGFRYGHDRGVQVVKVDAWLGQPGSGTLVFSQNHLGSDLGSQYHKFEGTVAASGQGAFDYIVIYAPGGCLAIDDLTVRGDVSITNLAATEVRR